jgi:hypothetical protein
MKQLTPPAETTKQLTSPAAHEYTPKPAEEDAQPRLVAASLRSPAVEVESAVAASPREATEQIEATGPVTISGCLERVGDEFWLKNVSGDDAPRSRSWKSGFLRKRSPSIAVIDRGYTHRLANYVGQRIETTGALADREMRVRALRVLGSCD